MAKVHGIIFLVIGLFVSIASYKINYDKLYVFFYIGLLFIIYGVAKIIIGFINKDEKKQAPLNRLSQNQLNQLRQPVKQQYKRCQTCGNVARGHDNFCSRCGARISSQIQ